MAKPPVAPGIFRQLLMQSEAVPGERSKRGIVIPVERKETTGFARRSRCNAGSFNDGYADTAKGEKISAAGTNDTAATDDDMHQAVPAAGSVGGMPIKITAFTYNPKITAPMTASQSSRVPMASAPCDHHVPLANILESLRPDFWQSLV